MLKKSKKILKNLSSMTSFVSLPGYIKFEIKRWIFSVVILRIVTTTFHIIQEMKEI